MILVTGASGYIGSHLIASLRNEGLPVICLVRKETPKYQIEYLSAWGAQIITGDLLQPYELISQLQGKVKKVVHLAGSIVASKKETFETVHWKKTASLVSICKTIKVEKIVLLTAVGADKNAQSEYSRTKWMAEEEVRKSGIPFVILRSSLVFGNLGGLRNSKMVIRLSELVKRYPFVPVIGNGKNLVQPVFIGDLVTCLKKSVIDDKLANKTIEIGGPERLPFNRLIDKLADYYDVRRIKIHIPFAIMFPIASFLEKILSTPPISRDQLKILQKDNVCRTDEMRKYFPVKMVKFEEGLKA